MDMLIILNTVVNQLTDGFSKSQSVNYTYKMCKRIVETKMKEMEVYSFDILLDWLNAIKSNLYKGKYKCIKRIVYGLNSYINNEMVDQSQRFIYQNDNSQFKKLSNISKKIIVDYVNKHSQCSKDYSSYIKNYISYYLLFVENNKLDYRNVSYEDIFKFKNYINSLELKYSTKAKILNHSANFIYETNENIKGKVGATIIKTIHNNYIEKIIKIKKDDLTSFDMSTIEIEYENIKLFYDELIKRGYAIKTQKHVKKIINELLFFFFYYDISINSNNILLWSKYVYENIVKDLEYRSFGIKFIEYLENGDFINKNSYFNSVDGNPHIKHRKIEDIPEWSKNMVDKYIAYRKNLGYKNNTICMDCNSIYRFIKYLESVGINDYNQIKPTQLTSFLTLDEHSTLEGKNAYITRVRSFLIFLKDNNIINIYVDSRIFGNFKTEKKLVKIIEADDISKILSVEYKTSYEIRAYAIFLLAIRCGLRSVDIVNLKFKDISYINKTLNIIQTKTQKEITLPIPTIVLNAIYNYVKSARPKSSSEYIFIRHITPYEKLNRKICAASFDKLKRLNGIDNNKYTGFHICRKTFASSIINKTQNIDITAFSLGHSDNSTVDDYISIDTSNMHECALTLDDICYGGFEIESL